MGLMGPLWSLRPYSQPWTFKYPYRLRVVSTNRHRPSRRPRARGQKTDRRLHQTERTRPSVRLGLSRRSHDQGGFRRTGTRGDRQDVVRRALGGQRTVINKDQLIDEVRREGLRLETTGDGGNVLMTWERGNQVERGSNLETPVQSLKNVIYSTFE